MTLDPKAMDAASYAMQEVSCCSSENICEVCRKDASVVVTSYLTHALPALLAAAERRGAEAMRERAAVCVEDAEHAALTLFDLHQINHAAARAALKEPK